LLKTTVSTSELSLIEKRDFILSKEVRKKHIAGTVQRDLFDDTNLKINL
jgi:hypothetical protein